MKNISTFGFGADNRTIWVSAPKTCTGDACMDTRMQAAQRSILIMAGGTGGHIFDFGENVSCEVISHD